MTTSPFELALKLLLNAAIGLVLLGAVRRSWQRGYATGLWWDFQRESEPVRFWSCLVFLTLAGFGGIWVAVRAALELTGI